MGSLKLAVVQFTPRFGKKEENLNRLAALVSGIGADVIVYPELCTTGYLFTSRSELDQVAEEATGPTFTFFQELADRIDSVLVAGFAERAGASFYNSCLIVLPGENKPIVYRSHDGRIIRAAGPSGDAVLAATVDPQQTRDKSFNPINNVLSDRKPRHYSALTKL